jgi:hypothetical protein
LGVCEVMREMSCAFRASNAVETQQVDGRRVKIYTG